MDLADPSNPQVWWRLLVDAVAGLQRNDMSPATAYLQFTEKHRDRRVAIIAKRNLNELKRAPSWANCRMWPEWGYRHQPPPPPPAPPKPTKRKTRK